MFSSDQAILRLFTGSEVSPEKSQSQSPLRHFRLCHVDSIIKFLILRLVRAKKIMIRNDQNPFEQVILITIIKLKSFLYCLS